MAKEKTQMVEVLPATPENIRSFGVGVAMILLACWAVKFFYFETGNSGLMIGLALCFAIVGMFATPILKPVFVVFMWLAHKIGTVNTYIILGIVYYIIMTPIGVVMKLFGKAPLPAMGTEMGAESYWIKRDGKLEKESYEREY
jgi:hypothetical protein